MCVNNQEKRREARFSLVTGGPPKVEKPSWFHNDHGGRPTVAIASFVPKSRGSGSRIPTERILGFARQIRLTEGPDLLEFTELTSQSVLLPGGSK